MWQLLYWFDKNFRRLLDAKRRGPDDKLATGETIVVVLRKATS